MGGRGRSRRGRGADGGRNAHSWAAVCWVAPNLLATLSPPLCRGKEGGTLAAVGQARVPKGKEPHLRGLAHLLRAWESVPERAFGGRQTRENERVSRESSEKTKQTKISLSPISLLSSRSAGVRLTSLPERAGRPGTPSAVAASLFYHQHRVVDGSDGGGGRDRGRPQPTQPGRPPPPPSPPRPPPGPR